MRALLLVALLSACKDKQAAPAALPPAPAQTVASDAAPVGVPATPRPAVPTEAEPPLGEPLSLEDAAKALPTLQGKEMLPLRQTSDKRQVHATWCLDGESADDVARQVGRQMADAGYRDLAIRGDARKAGVQGARDGFRMSMIVSASSAASCMAPAHYFASATIFREP